MLPTEARGTRVEDEGWRRATFTRRAGDQGPSWCPGRMASRTTFERFSCSRLNIATRCSPSIRRSVGHSFRNV